MSLDDIIDPKTHDIKVEITEQMRSLARDVVRDYRLGHPSYYEEALGRFKKAVYEANPYLDPAAMVRSNGQTPMFTQRIDMERASGKVLNDLLAETAKDQGYSLYPRPFDQKMRY